VRSVGTPRAWDPEVIDQAIPELPEPTRNGHHRSGGEPPVELGPAAVKAWRGEKPKSKDGGGIDRSGSLVKIGRELYNAGAPRPVIVAALAERDEALGWRKYTGRPDADRRYHEIVDELERNGRNGRMRMTVGSNGRASVRAFNLTDLGNAERFVAHHGADVRYCYPWRKWLVRTGARWERDEAGLVHRLAKETVRGIYREASDAEEEDRRKALAKHAAASESEARIRAMVELAKSEAPVSPNELDADPWLLNVQNGTINLRTGELREHQREDLITKLAPVEYDPDATAPTWEAFLERVLPGEELRGFVQRAVGYSATGDTSEQCMFIHHGPGANGKSTFQEAVTAALGDYAMRTPTETLLVKRAGGVPNDVARLKGARFVTASETEEGRRLAESLVKDLTGQDTISARFMWAEWFDFKPTHALHLSTNHKPEIRGTDPAIWRRIRLIPWAVTIPPAEQDRKLAEKLRDELPGVLAWIVRGCSAWLQEGLKAPEEVRQATKAYRAEMDVLAAFLADCCVRDEDESAFAGELWGAWKRWCDESGEQAGTQKRFGGRLAERGFLNHRDSRTGRKLWSGLSLRPNWESRSGLTLNHSNTRFAGDSEPPEPSEPKNNKVPQDLSREETLRKKGSEGSDGSAEAVSEAHEHRIHKLIRGGMAENAARRQVLANDHPLDCGCGVCR
jgi:P4 family phage/plasmid primase-like protien